MAGQQKRRPEGRRLQSYDCCRGLAALDGIPEIFAAVVETAIVDAIVKMVTAMAADVMAMGPAVAGPVTGDPDHLVVACPVASAVTIVRAVANFD